MLQNYEASLKDFRAVARARPNDKDAQTKFKECDKIVRRMRFERAIAVEEKQEKPMVETVREQLKMLSGCFFGAGVCVCCPAESLKRNGVAPHPVQRWTASTPARSWQTAR